MLQRNHILVHFRHTDVLVYAENAYYTFLRYERLRRYGYYPAFIQALSETSRQRHKVSGKVCGISKIRVV